MRHDRIVIWGARAVLALALAFFSEIMWWSNDPLALSAGAWGARAILYLALAALLLDLMARFEVGELFGVLVLAGLYGLLNGALVSGGALAALPLSLVTRPLGLHTLGGGVLALLWLGWLLDGRGFVPWRAALLAGIGLLWGMWVRWYPLLPSNTYPLPALSSALVLVIGGLVLLGVAFFAWGRLARRGALALETGLRLSPWAWGAVAGALGVTLAQQARAGAIDTLGGVLLGVLAGYLVVLLVFLRAGVSATPFLRRFDPPQLAGPGVYALYAALLVIPAALGYTLPGDGPEALPLRALTTALTVFGILWLPGVSLGIGLRAYIRLFRQEG
ncbi:MAG: hypothetical protein JXN59_17640 [Anaerolineae bacterium]|nr:hypothetical protein [Anaerolineae bacterium]